MNIIYIVIGVTLRVLFELFALAASIAWFVVCAVIGTVGFILVFIVSLFTNKPNIPS